MKYGFRHWGVEASLRSFAWCLSSISTCGMIRSDYSDKITGWWFGTFFILTYIGNNHPNCRHGSRKLQKADPSACFAGAFHGANLHDWVIL